MRQKLLILVLLIPLLASSIGAVPTFQSLDTNIETSSQTVNTLINQVLIVIILVGLIYVVGTLITSATPNRGVMITWFVSIVIWGLGNLIFFAGAGAEGN